MSVHVQTGNMLDVVIEGKSIGLKQRDSDHRKYDVIWLPEPENVAMVLLAEIDRLNGRQPTRTPNDAAVRAAADEIGHYLDSYTPLTCGERVVKEFERIITRRLAARTGELQ